MKTLHLLTLCIAASANANLIDLTPGGTPFSSGPPIGIAAHGFYDSAAFGFFDPGHVFMKGWVSKYGILDGGQNFFTDLINQPVNPLTATVSWDFGSASGYWLKYILVEGFAPNGNGANLYKVPFGSRLSGEGTVTIDGLTTIDSIAFYGRNPAYPWAAVTTPDSGETFSLMLIALLCAATYEQLNRRRFPRLALRSLRAGVETSTKKRFFAKPNWNFAKVICEQFHTFRKSRRSTK